MFKRVAVTTTACRRPYYLLPTLESWGEVRGTDQLSRFTVKLGPSSADIEGSMLEIIRNARVDAWPGVDIRRDYGRGVAMHGAMGEEANRLFTTDWMDFVVFGEEDVVVSDDVLEYMFWAARRFRDDHRVLAVCAHSVGGQGWDEHEPADDAHADQTQVRLLPYFNAWCWGTWRDRWEGTLAPQWDWDCRSGGSTDSGWDWNIATRILPRGNFLCVVPDASRSQNIGAREGWASTPESFAFSQAQSFRAHRDPIDYKLVTE